MNKIIKYFKNLFHKEVVLNQIITYGNRPDGKPKLHLGSCINASGQNLGFRCYMCETLEDSPMVRTPKGDVYWSRGSS